jgi:broad specificity phosphatase PhoE
VGGAVEIVPALDEIDFGEWTGCSFEELGNDPAWRAWNSRRAVARAPQGESMEDVVVRASRHLEALAAREWDGAVVCVTHCDIIRGVIAHYLGLELDNLLRFDVAPGSVSTMVIGGWGGRLMSLNEEWA